MKTTSKSHFNLSTLVKITINDKRLCKDFIWKDEKKGWFSTRPAGFYNTYEPSGIWPVEHLTSGNYPHKECVYSGTQFLVIGKEVYSRPSVTLTFLGQYNYFHHSFPTLKEAEEYVQGIQNKTSDVIWIEHNN